MSLFFCSQFCGVVEQLGHPLQSIPFAAVVVAGVDGRYSALILSFIVSESWYGCCSLSVQAFFCPKKIEPIVSRISMKLRVVLFLSCTLLFSSLSSFSLNTRQEREARPLLTNYGTLEFGVLDPDGYILAFAEELWEAAVC